MVTGLGFASVLVVFIINLVLGWTLIGWAIALVTACGANRRARVGKVR